jgi:hypothetical protein
MREWTRWAGRGNGPVADLGRRAVDLVLDIGAIFPWGVGDGVFPHTIRGRVGLCRRGGYEEVQGAWRQAGRGVAPVTVVLNGAHRFIESDDFTIPLAAVAPLGILDYPRRPRATTQFGGELDYGVVLRTDAQVSALLLCKPDLSVIAILAGWPSPADLTHGQTVTDICKSVS